MLFENARARRPLRPGPGLLLLALVLLAAPGCRRVNLAVPRLDTSTLVESQGAHWQDDEAQTRIHSAVVGDSLLILVYSRAPDLVRGLR